MHKLFTALITAIALMIAPAMASTGGATGGSLGGNLVYVEDVQACEPGKSIAELSQQLASDGVDHIVLTGQPLEAVGVALEKFIGPKPAEIQGMIVVGDPDNPQHGGLVGIFDQNLCLKFSAAWPSDMIKAIYDNYKGV